MTGHAVASVRYVVSFLRHAMNVTKDSPSLADGTPLRLVTIAHIAIRLFGGVSRRALSGSGIIYQILGRKRDSSSSRFKQLPLHLHKGDSGLGLQDDSLCSIGAAAGLASTTGLRFAALNERVNVLLK